MKAVLTAEEMRLAERAYFATGLSSFKLMERAAEALADELTRMLGGGEKTCVFACGGGGNGGDGYAAARIFAERGGRAILLPVCPPNNEDARAHCELAQGKVFACADIARLDELPRPDAWADCMLGIGASRPLDGAYARVVKRINADRARGSKVICADIPTGLSADTGAILGACVCADVTVSFQSLKRGHLLGRGMDVCGLVKPRALGIPDECVPEGVMRLVEKGDVARALPARPRTAHKNDFGHLMIVAGARGMAGAAYICAAAAMRAGAGLVTIACPESILPVLQTLAPCAMCLPLVERAGAISAEARDQLCDALRGKTAIAAGPGLSERADAGIIELLLKCGLPAVFDADALNLIAKNEGLKSLLSPIHAITPHPGEAARLLGERVEDAATCAKKLRALGCKALVKGAASVICADDLYVSASGCVGMAKGGSGDALTGMVGALLAQGCDAGTALWLGSELHGRAGEIASARAGEISMSPQDLVDAIGEAYASVKA